MEEIEVEDKLPASVAQAKSGKTNHLSLLKADKNMDPIAAKMFTEAEEKRISEETKIIQDLDHITNPKKTGKTTNKLL